MGFLASNDKTYSLVHGNVERHYYKYQYTAYNRPNLTSNTGNPKLQVWYSSAGTTWGQAYEAFDGNTSTYIHSYQRGGGLSEASLYMYTPEDPLNITGLTGNLLATESANPSGSYTIYLYGSNDNSAYNLIYSSGYGSKTSFNLTFTNHSYYTYHRIRMYCGGSDDHDEVGAIEIYPIATIKSVTDGTSTDYDFYKDTYINYTLKHGTKTF